jgi:uncharacterized protein (UPF0248 family)
MYIGDLLNKIRWDKTSKPEEYMLVYFDRMAGKSYEVAFTAIGREGNFFTIMVNGQKTSIPIHRIRQVKKQGKVVWERV